MNVEIFALCDAATVDSGGKINILGVFDRINHRQAPITHQNCAIVIKIRFSLPEEGIQNLQLSFIGAEGNEVIPALTLQVNVQFPTGESTATTQLVLLVPRLVLPNFGEYSIDLAVGGNPAATMPLFVRQIEDGPSLFAPPGPH